MTAELHIEGFASLKKPLLSQEVETAIKKSIQDGIYKPGEKIPPERVLVEQFQVSRVTIREALRNLQRSGLITVRRGVKAGAYVSELTSEPITENFQNLIQMGRIDYSHLIDARLYIEPRAAEMAAKYRTAQDLHRLEALLDKAEGLLAESRKQARLLNVSFHCEVAKITKNPIIVFITESITQSYSALIIDRTSDVLGTAQVQKFIDEHRDILNSVIKQNSAEAYEKTRRHLLETYLTYSKHAPKSLQKDIDRRIRQDCNL
jgi:GntR family transcriptional regulator, transcriptional repressor for pyruvate dehydrogenase complex